MDGGPLVDPTLPRPGPVRLGEWLSFNAARTPAARCFVDEGVDRVLTFAEVNGRVNRLADSLRAAGAQRGDRLAILDVDSFRYMETLLASMKLGTVYVPLNFRLVPDELATLLEAAGASWLFVGERYAELAAGVQARVAGLEHVVAFAGARAPQIDYEAFVMSGSDAERASPVEDEDIVGLAFTSGTTGRPKGVLQSHRMMKMMVLNGMVCLNTAEGEFRYSAAPLFHIGGMAMVLHGIARGFPNLILPQFDPDVVLRWMQSGEITSVFLVPTMINRLLAVPGVADHDYSRLKSIVYGAAPMTPVLLRRSLEVFNCDFIQVFAAGTEAGGQTVLDADDHRRALAGEEHLLSSVGRATFGVELRVVDDDMRDVAPGEVGEIATRSDTIMSGYLGHPEESARALRDGWFRAGDMAWADDEGYLYLAGRKSDMIIRGGENVYPIEIETVLANYPGVEEVAVIGLGDVDWGETVCAVLVMAKGASRPSDDELRRHCRRSLAAYKCPARFEFCRSMPLNASGKILKTELRHRYGAPTGEPA